MKRLEFGVSMIVRQVALSGSSWFARVIRSLSPDAYQGGKAANRIGVFSCESAGAALVSAEFATGQSYRSAQSSAWEFLWQPRNHHFAEFSVDGKDVMNEPRTARRNLQLKDVLARLSEPIRESPELEASLPDCAGGVVAKRRDSRYEIAERSGAWQKMRVNQGCFS
jgi:hypothetical protein